MNLGTARDLYKAGKLKEAAEICGEILKLSPQDASASHLLGCILSKRGDAVRAAQWMRKAIDIDSDNLFYKCDLGHLFLTIGRINDAEILLGEVAKREPENAAALLLLGQALFKQGKRDAAWHKWQSYMSLKCRAWISDTHTPPYHPFNTEKFDLPDYDGERLTYFICATPRCGSTLLGDLLVQSGDLGVPHEYMNFINMGVVLAERFGIDLADPQFFQSYFEAVKRVRTTPNGVFGIKTHFHQFRYLVEPPILNVIFDKPKFIQILRRNRIAQAVSYSIALRSSKWNSTQEAQKEPDYDKADIDKRLNIILSEELNWMMFFQIHEIDQYTIYYEDLVADSASVCQGLAEYLGVDTDFDFDIAGAEFKKVSGRKNSDWENRYRAEASLLRI